MHFTQSPNHDTNKPKCSQLECKCHRYGTKTDNFHSHTRTLSHRLLLATHKNTAEIHNISFSQCVCLYFVMFALMIMSTGTSIIHIFIKITHVIRLTFRKREEDAFDEDTLSFQFQLGRHMLELRLHTV